MFFWIETSLIHSLASSFTFRRTSILSKGRRMLAMIIIRLMSFDRAPVVELVVTLGNTMGSQGFS